MNLENRDFSYGVLSYSSVNIGDEIQSIAAMRFLPKVEEYVYRDLINTFEPKHNKNTIKITIKGTDCE